MTPSQNVGSNLIQTLTLLRTLSVQNLESLNVAYCGAITDSAMRSLSRLTALTRLNFGRCNKVRAFSLYAMDTS